MTIHNSAMPKSPPTLHYLSFVPNRYAGKYKVHQNIGHAKNAISCKMSYYSGSAGGVIWKWDEAENVWVELFRVEPGAKELPW